MLRKTYLRSSFMSNMTVLGFTGGIASGKSTRCAHLLKLAEHKAQQPGVSLYVASISADVVGHSTYEPGKPAYNKLLEKFGRDAILSDNGVTIDRKKLGAIVFDDKKKMQELNSIVWPAIDEALLAEMERKSSEAALKLGKRSSLIILEAAVLIEHGFVKHCTDVWLASCAKEEATRRVMERNGLDYAAALTRVESQMSIEDRLLFLKNSGFSGDVRHFDTTHTTLAAGLKEVSAAFDDYWNVKLRPLLRATAQG